MSQIYGKIFYHLYEVSYLVSKSGTSYSMNKYKIVFTKFTFKIITLHYYLNITNLYQLIRSCGQ